MKVIKKELVCDEEDIDWVQTEKHVFETASNHPFLVGLHSCFQTPSESGKIEIFLAKMVMIRAWKFSNAVIFMRNSSGFDLIAGTRVFLPLKSVYFS